MAKNKSKWYQYRNWGTGTETKIICTKPYKCTDKYTKQPVEMSRKCRSCDWAEVQLLLNEKDRFIRALKTANPPQTYSEFMESIYRRK